MSKAKIPDGPGGKKTDWEFSIYPLASNDGLIVPPRQPVEGNLDHVFTCFENLPTEIRQMIWRFALQPRIVHINQKIILTNRKLFRRHDFEYITVPVTLQICRESRKLALEQYDLVSLSDTWIAEYSSLKPESRKCYVDFENDIIFTKFLGWRRIIFNVEALLRALDYSEKITQLAYEPYTDAPRGRYHDSRILPLLALKKLRRIDIVCCTGYDVPGEQIFFRRIIKDKEPPRIDNCTRKYSWAELVNGKMKALGLDHWPRDISIDFVVPYFQSLDNNQFYFPPRSHFSYLENWMRGDVDFWAGKKKPSLNQEIQEEEEREI